MGPPRDAKTIIPATSYFGNPFALFLCLWRVVKVARPHPSIILGFWISKPMTFNQLDRPSRLTRLHSSCAQPRIRLQGSESVILRHTSYSTSELHPIKIKCSAQIRLETHIPMASTACPTAPQHFKTSSRKTHVQGSVRTRMQPKSDLTS